MKKRIVALLLLAAAVIGTLSSCKNEAEVVKFSDDRGEKCVDSKTNITYKYASSVYEPSERGELYGELSVGDNLAYELYTIKGADSNKWLATEHNVLLYAEGEKLPTLSEMETVAIKICTTEASQAEIMRMLDAADISAVVNAFADGENLAYQSVTPYKKYQLRFMSEKYPALCYSLSYMEYSKDQYIGGENRGKYFIYDKYNKIFVAVGSEIHDTLAGMSPDASADTEGETT